MELNDLSTLTYHLLCPSHDYTDSYTFDAVVSGDVFVFNTPCPLLKQFNQLPNEITLRLNFGGGTVVYKKSQYFINKIKQDAGSDELQYSCRLALECPGLIRRRIFEEMDAFEQRFIENNQEAYKELIANACYDAVILPDEIIFIRNEGKHFHIPYSKWEYASLNILQQYALAHMISHKIRGKVAFETDLALDSETIVSGVTFRLSTAK